MKKIWDTQNKQTLYAFDEEALHRSVTSKKRAASRRINVLELLLLGIQTFFAIKFLYDGIYANKGWWAFMFSGVFFITIAYLIIFRIHRKKNENCFDRSVLGELEHAITNTKSVIQIASTMMTYYLIPVLLLAISKMIVTNAPLEKWLWVVGLFGLSFALIQWEKKVCHIPRKVKLLKLKQKLINE